jgi:hypothetical protein
MPTPRDADKYLQKGTPVMFKSTSTSMILLGAAAIIAGMDCALQIVCTGE